MKKNFILVIFCILAFVLSLYFALFKGNTSLSFNDLLNLLTNKNTDEAYILGTFRFPRVIRAIVAGTCLALSGMFMQSLTKNPLAEPYLTGVSSGAGLALILGIILGISPLYYPVLGFSGAIMVSFLVISFAGFRKISVIKLILGGLSINIFTASLISMLVLVNSDKTHNLMMVLSGSLNNSIVFLNPLLIVFITCMTLSLFIIPKLNFVRLDRIIVSSLSSKSQLFRSFLLILSSALAAVSVFASGILGFVGIIIPHISRLLFGQDYRWLFVANILIGSTFILVSDYIARTVIYPSELPLGLVLSLTGAPIFAVFLMVKGKELV